MEYHGNLLSTEFINKDFLKNYKILQKRKSLKNPWVHYQIRIPNENLEKTIRDIQLNLVPEKYYAHLYNEDGSDVIVIFPKKVFRLSIKDKEGWAGLHKFMNGYGVPTDQQNPNPKRFQDEIEYYKDKPIVK